MKHDLRNILVVEDEPDLRDIIVSLLKENHSSVDQAENGEVALRMVREKNYALVVSDIRMPVMDGLSFFAAAKGLGIPSPFVFITAFGDRENMLKALRLGAFDFIKKPFDDDEVNSVVDRALEVGYRRNLILSSIETALGSREDEELSKVKKNDQMIRLLEISNYKKRM